MASDKKGTIIELLIFLWQNTDCFHPATNEDINAYMQKYDYCLDRKTISDHIRILNDCLEKTGLEICIDRVNRKNTYYLSGKTFEREQITEIIMAVIQSKSVSDTNSQEFIEKLFSLLSIHEARQVKDSLYGTTSVIRRSNAVSFVIGELLQAINKQKKVAIMYKKDMYSKDKSDITQRIISPYCLSCNDNAMYLICHYPEHNSPRSFFRLDRITDVKILDEPADLPGKKHAMEDSLEYNKKMTIGDKITVILEFKPDVSTVVYDRYGDIHTTHTDFGYKISESDILSNELLGWLFMLGDNIRILGCENLKNAFNERLAMLSEINICK